MQTTMDSSPAAARAAILKTVADGKLDVVESCTKTGQPTMCEAAFTDKKNKKHEVLIKADGTEAQP